MKTFALIFVLLLCFFICPKKYDPFAPSMLAYDMQGDYPLFACPELENIAASPLKYLGHGRQSIAFQSADGRYVVKFFLMKQFFDRDKYTPSSIRNLFPKHRQKKEARRLARREKYIRNAIHNYDEAFRHLKEETGLVAVHLQPDGQNLPQCRIIDRLGKMHEIDLDRASFVVQRRAEERVWDEEDRAKVRELLTNRALKGFTDRHGCFHLRHVGFQGKIPVIIDPGNMEFHPEILAHPENELQRIRQINLGAALRSHPVPVESTRSYDRS